MTRVTIYNPWTVERNNRNRLVLTLQGKPVIEITRAPGSQDHGRVKSRDQLLGFSGQIRDSLNKTWNEQIDGEPNENNNRLTLNEWQMGLAVFGFTLFGAIVGTIL